MRTPFPPEVEAGRLSAPYGHFAHSSPGDDYGIFEIRRPGFPKPFRIVASSGDEHVRWEHVSVSIPKVPRCPTWDEMSWVKSLFWGDDEAVVQFHPPKAEHVNFHPYCLHLWKPWDGVLALPPSIAVGPKGVAGRPL